MPLYHFTDARNLASIKRHGLLSWRKLLDRKIPHHPASNELSRTLDQKKGLDNYVRFCRKPEHPMAGQARFEGRVGNLVWLEISDAITNWRATKFSNRNATASNATISSERSTALESDCVQAEILVEGALAPRWISFPRK